jgi:hypothetical protein
MIIDSSKLILEVSLLGVELFCSIFTLAGLFSLLELLHDLILFLEFYLMFFQLFLFSRVLWTDERFFCFLLGQQ